jgi:hypothetical protein
VAHKFQLEIAELIPLLLAHAGDRDALYAAAPLNHPGTVAACWDPADPEDISRHYHYIHWYQGTFPAARFSLFLDADNGNRPYHNMEASSRWLGAYRYDAGGGAACAGDDQCSLGACVQGQCEAEFWDTFATTTSEGRGIGNGDSTESGFPSCLVHTAQKLHPCNFYGPDAAGTMQYPELFVRGSMAALFNLLFVMESDRFLLPVIDNNSFYSGSYQLNGFYNLVAAFGEAGSVLADVLPMGERLHRAWAKGLRQVIDRAYTQVMVSSLNQNSHTMMALEHFPRGLENPAMQAGYRAMARRWAERFVGEQHPAGYFREGAGIDATYTGITHNFIGFYYRMSEQDPEGPDTVVLDAIRRSYEFYNHTIGQEPTGGYLGCSDFANRTAGDFAHEQYGGARGIVEQLGEVSYRMQPSDGDNSDLRSRTQNFEAAAQFVYDYTQPGENGSHNTIGILSEGEFKDPSRRPGDYVLPAHRAETFTRNLSDADTLLAVKRPGYYAAFFVGKPGAQWMLDRNIALFQEPHPDEGLPPTSVTGFGGHGPTMSDGDPHIYPFLGGGISFLHTTGFGVLLAGANWNPHTHHGLVAELSDGTRRWTRYHSRGFTLDETAGTLVTTGGFDDLPLEFTRTFTFHDDRIDVELVITATGDVTLTSFAEVFPVPTCSRSPCADTVINRKQNGASLSGLGAPVGDGLYDTTTDSFSLVDDAATTGMTVTFTGDLRITASQHGMRYRVWADEYQIGWVKAHLPGSWTANDSHTLGYTISPQ